MKKKKKKEKKKENLKLGPSIVSGDGIHMSKTTWSKF